MIAMPVKNTFERKKLDPRIIDFVRHGRYSHQRSIFVVRGKKACDAVPILYGILDTVVGFSGTSSLLWCFHKNSGFSLRRQKLFKRYNKRKKVGTCENVDENNALRVFIARTEVRFCYYSETRNILGKTFGACVLQDAKEMTPNVLARAVETVQGGGLIFLLMPSWMNDEPLNEVAGEDNTFLLYLLSSLLDMQNCIVVDDKLDVNFIPDAAAIRLKVQPQAPPGGTWISPDTEELKELQRSLQVSDSPFSSLVSTCKTVDQARALQQLLELLMKFMETNNKTSYSGLALLTAARGRGKSAALGLGVVAALEAGLSRILVTSPSAENVATLLQFTLHGLQRLCLEEMVDYNVHYMKAADVFGGSGLSGKMAHKIVIQRRGGAKQTVRYVPPDAAVAASGAGTADLLCIDEAAALHIPLLRQLLVSSIPLTFLATTVSGYEGTGHALVQLLQTEIENRMVHINLHSSIRYALGDPVEAWLGRVLCLDAPLGPPGLTDEQWSPDDCELWAVNRNLLFGWDRRVRSILSQVAAFLAVSDYVTSPDELKKIANGEEQRIYVLLPPKRVWPKDREQIRVFAVIQAHMEGGDWHQPGQEIPPLVREVTGDEHSMRLPYLVIHRVVTHPALRGRGFGTRAMQLLYKAMEEQSTSNVTEEKQSRLLCPLNSMSSDQPRFLATRFELETRLLRFFVHYCGFSSLDVDPHGDSQKCFLMRSILPADQSYLQRKHSRFVRNLSCGRRGLGPYRQMSDEDVALLRGDDKNESSESNLSSSDEAIDDQMDAEEHKNEGKWWISHPPVPLLINFLHAQQRSGSRGLLVLRGVSSRLIVPDIASCMDSPLLWCCSSLRKKSPHWAAPMLRAALSSNHGKSLAELLAKQDVVSFCSANQLLECQLRHASYSVCVLETSSNVCPRLLAAAASVLSHTGLLVLLLTQTGSGPLADRLEMSLKANQWPIGAILRLGNDQLALVNDERPDEVEIEEDPDPESISTSLMKLCRGAGQRRLLIHLLGRLGSLQDVVETTYRPFMITSGRSAGKSTVLGLFASAALATGRTAVLVISPLNEVHHRRRMKEAVERGLREIGLTDIEEDTQDVVLRCAGIGRQRAVRFLDETEAEAAVLGGEGDLIIVEEAAGLSEKVLEAVKAAQCQVILTTTVSGPGMAGGSRYRRLKNTLWPSDEDGEQWEMESTNGRLEQWLAKVLLLPSSPEWLMKMEMALPHPERCSLWRINGIALRSGSTEGEDWLRIMHGVCVARHIGVDALNEWENIVEGKGQWFVLMDPPNVFKQAELRVRCFLKFQECFGSPKIWLYERPGSDDGGYAERAVRLLLEHLRGDLFDHDRTNEEGPDDIDLPVIINISCFLPRPANLHTVAVEVHIEEEERIRRLQTVGFRPTVLKASKNLRLMAGLSEEGKSICSAAVKTFTRKFLKRGGGAENLPVKTSFHLLQAAVDDSKEKILDTANLLEPEDWHQLKQLGDGELLDFRSLRNALRRLCRLVFLNQLPNLILSNLHKQVLLGVAMRQLDFQHLAVELSTDLRCHLEKAVLRMALQFAAKRLYSNLRGLLVRERQLTDENNKPNEEKLHIPGQRAITEMQKEMDDDELVEKKSQQERLLEIVESFKNSSESFSDNTLKNYNIDEMEFKPMSRKRGRDKRTGGGLKKRKQK